MQRKYPIFVGIGIASLAILFLMGTQTTEGVALSTLGKNTLGQLGNYSAAGNVGEALLPMEPLALAAGFDHTLALLADGSVYAWGDNRFGQLGLGSKKASINAPKKIPELEGVVSVAAGFRHSLALTKDGTVYAWGSNIAGQLGDNTHENASLPKKISLPAPATLIAAGHRFSLAKLSDGRVFAWGANCDTTTERAFAELLQMIGDGATGISYYVDGGADPSHAREEELCEFQGFVFVQNGEPVEIPELAGAVKLATGFGHVVALMPDGTVRTAGCNAYGQVGRVQLEVTPPTALAEFNGSSTSAVAIDIAASTRHTLVLDTEGRVWAFGANNTGQLGDTETPSSGRIKPKVIAGLPKISKIYAGHDYSLMQSEDGRLYSIGTELATTLTTTESSLIATGGGHIVYYTKE